MNDHDIESIWNGRFSDDIHDKWQELAKRCTSYRQFEYMVKKVIKEMEND